MSLCGWRHFRFSGWAGGNSDLVAAPRSGEFFLFFFVLSVGGNSDLVAAPRSGEKIEFFVVGGISDLVAGLEGIQI